LRMRFLHPGTERAGITFNCPMDSEEYKRFYEALIAAECEKPKGFEKENLFEGCMPVEMMARRGYDTLRFGPLKPVGVRNPDTGESSYAVVQLRREDTGGTMYSLVGFQTHLKFQEQKRVFSLIPGLENLEILRYGVMHKNTYIDSPKVLDAYGRLKADERISFAGQITGLEGYIESAAGGLIAGIFTAAKVCGFEMPAFGDKTVLGALLKHITASKTRDFQPMNANHGILEALPKRIRNKAEKGMALSARSLLEIDEAKKKFKILEANHV